MDGSIRHFLNKCEILEESDSSSTIHTRDSPFRTTLGLVLTLFEFRNPHGKMDHPLEEFGSSTISQLFWKHLLSHVVHIHKDLYTFIIIIIVGIKVGAKYDSTSTPHQHDQSSEALHGMKNNA